MQSLNAIIDTTSFEKAWSEVGDDSVPPPGRPFAQALLDRLVRETGISSLEPVVGIDMWEHSNWYFWVIQRGRTFMVGVEPLPDDERTPLRWRLFVSRVRIPLFELLFRRRTAHLVPEEFLATFEKVITEVATPTSFSWKRDDEIHLIY